MVKVSSTFCRTNWACGPLRIFPKVTQLRKARVGSLTLVCVLKASSPNQATSQCGPLHEPSDCSLSDLSSPAVPNSTHLCKFFLNLSVQITPPMQNFHWTHCLPDPAYHPQLCPGALTITFPIYLPALSLLFPRGTLYHVGSLSGSPSSLSRTSFSLGFNPFLYPKCQPHSFLPHTQVLPMKSLPVLENQN